MSLIVSWDELGSYIDHIKGYKYLDIDGVKVLFDDGFALVRASNTGPNLTMRFEAKTEERLSQINGEFVKLVDEFNK